MILITADLHLTANRRDQYRFKTMEAIADLIEKYNPEVLVILGDLTEEKNFHSARLTNDVVELIYAFSEMCRVDIELGNHDYTDADSPFFYFVRHLKNVRWINKPTLSQITADTLVQYLPHTNDYEKDWAKVDFTDVDWVFAHNTFEGATSEHGHRLHGIPTTAFPKGIRVISGDIHTPQTIGPVTYVGAPYTVDFGDDYEPRAILLSGKELRSLPIPGPQKRLVSLKAGYEPGSIEANPGDIIKVRYKLLPSERERWPEIKTDIRLKLNEQGLDAYLIQPQLEQSDTKRAVAKARRDIRSDEDAVRSFAKQLGVSAETLETGLSFCQPAGSSS